MIRNLYRRIFREIVPAWGDDRAAQLAEFAMTLPLLILFVVGIFDFSSAFTLKQKLTNIARDAARAAAADPSNDLQSPGVAGPASVLDAFQLIDNYLLANKLNDCGIAAGASPSGLTWTFTASNNGCLPPGLKIVINRGYFFPVTGASPPASNCTSQAAAGSTSPTLIGTCVSISYAYPWRFGRVASLLGNTELLPQQITGMAVAFNEN